MDYLDANRAVGTIMLVVLIFFVCALAALRWDEIKADFSTWKRQRQLKKANRPTKKGLHK